MKIGKETIEKIEQQKDSDLDYESILATFHAIQRKEKEQFELKKKIKMNDIEI